MKKIITSIIKYVFTFVILILIFNFLLYLTCSFNSSIIKKNVWSSYEFLSNQGLFYKMSDVFDLWNNNCTEAVIINESYSIDSDKPFTSYMKARKNYNPETNHGEYEEDTGEGVTINYDFDLQEEVYDGEYDSVGELGDFLNDRIHHAIPYGRYWHGYLVLYRPLLILFNIHQIKIIQIISFAILFLWFIFLLNKRFGKSIAFIFGSSLLCSGYFSASYSLESGPIFLITMISSIVLLKRIDKIKYFGIYFFIVGCITNFVDYLTVPLISLGIPCAIYLLKQIEDNKDWKCCLKYLIINSSIWLIGYAGTWICKWVLYDLTINDANSMINIGFYQSFYRMKRSNDTAGSGANYINRIINILGPESLYIVLSSMVLLWINKFKFASKGFNKKVFSFWLLSLYPVLWYVVLANHTLIHFYFTYRQSLIFMLGILLGFYILLFKIEQKNKK